MTSRNAVESIATTEALPMLTPELLKTIQLEHKRHIQQALLERSVRSPHPWRPWRRRIESEAATHMTASVRRHASGDVA
ncbi:MAG TPA: hypothetical protein VKA85_03810 [Candidatus Limnocylindrales bacterium]|nr:hypothetical protein [Candidatus Limnocylindrales bacterium]